MSLYKKKNGFTIIEISVVLSIALILSTFIIRNVLGKLAHQRDDLRVESIKSLQLALAKYHADTGSYPTPVGASSTCDGTFQQSLAPLVSGGYIDTIPIDPINKDAGNGRFCMFYYINTNCGQTNIPAPANPNYAFRFHTEQRQYPTLARWSNEVYSPGGHYCIFSPKF